MGISPLSRNAILKTLNCPFTPKEEFLEKLVNISITFVYLLFPIMLKVFFKKILRAHHEIQVAEFLGKLNSNFPHAP